MKNILQKTKRGGASMFVVMFTMIILSIIVLGFTRLILSEATKTTNTDLSQSAYDSALAGVEDAKMALLQYHSCLDKGFRSKNGGEPCEQLIYNMQTGIAKQDCSTVANVLGREHTVNGTENAVVVQETQNSSDAGNNTSMLQAYTCVTIKEDLEDYRTTLDSSSRLRIIPIRSASIDSLNRIQIKWFSQVNYNQLQKSLGISSNARHLCGNEYDVKAGFNTLKLFPLGSCKDEHTGVTGEQAPTSLAVRLIQTDENFNLSELSVSKAADQTNTGQLYLVPTYNNGTNSIPASAWGESANKGENEPIRINCNSSSWFCTADINLPKTFRGENRSDANTYLLVSIPYGSPETDISVTVWNQSGRQLFTGVQARIDSTGRANDLYRRVETRVELVDTYFAYPEFEVTMRGGENTHIKKTFDVTFNCRYGDDGPMSGCANSEESERYAGF
jgi:Tfp pilus assembly protein PilX